MSDLHVQQPKNPVYTGIIIRYITGVTDTDSFSVENLQGQMPTFLNPDCK